MDVAVLELSLGGRLEASTVLRGGTLIRGQLIDMHGLNRA